MIESFDDPTNGWVQYRAEIRPHIDNRSFVICFKFVSDGFPFPPSEGVYLDLISLKFSPSMGTPSPSYPLSGDVTSSTTPTFTWLAPEGVSNFEIQIANDPTFENIEVNTTVGTNSYTPISSLSVGRHYWRVRSKNGIIFGYWSPQNSFTVANVAVSQPSIGTIWAKGTIQNIVWTSNLAEDIWLDLYKGTAFQRSIVAETTNDGTHTWTLPYDVPNGSDYRVKLSTVPNISAFSQYFSITDAPTCNLLLAPNPLYFGEVTISTYANRDIILKNTGNAALTVDAITISGSDFSLLSPPGTPFVLTGGASQSVSVKFLPTSSGIQSGQVTMNITDCNNTSKTVTASLNGSGSSDGDMYSQYRMFTNTLINVGSSGSFGNYSVNVVSASTSPEAADIQISCPSTGYNSGTVHVTKDVLNLFDQNRFILFYGGTAVSPTRGIFRCGEAGYSPVITITPNEISTPAGTTAVLRVQTPGTSANFRTPIGSYHGADGAIVHGWGPSKNTINTSSFDFRIPIPLNATIRTYEVWPTFTCSYSGSTIEWIHILHINVTNPPLTKTIVANPDLSWNYGDVIVNTNADKVFALQNNGNSDLSVTSLSVSGSNANQFSIVSPPTLPLTIGSGGSHNITVRFAPSDTGTMSASFDIGNNSDNAGPLKSFGLQGFVHFAAVPPHANDAINISNHSFTINWNRINNTNGYLVDVSQNHLFTTFVGEYHNKDVGTDTSIAVVNVDSNSTFYFRVRSYTTRDTSGYSNTAVVTTILPLEIAFFNINVRGSAAELIWHTSTETNTSGFEIQRKTAEVDWQTIGFVDGGGNTSSRNRYTFIDNHLRATKYAYRLKQISNNGLFQFFGYHEIEIEAPKMFSLSQNFPNPFNPSTTISFNIPYDQYVLLVVYDGLGREVAMLVNEKKSAGSYSVGWSTKNSASGLYFARISAGEYTKMIKMTLIR